MVYWLLLSRFCIPNHFLRTQNIFYLYSIIFQQWNHFQSLFNINTLYIKTLYNLQIAHCFHEISIHIGKLCNLDIIIDARLGLSSVIDDKKTLPIFNYATKSKPRACSLMSKMKKRCESFRIGLRWSFKLNSQSYQTTQTKETRQFM
jgi:hypothetical protein